MIINAGGGGGSKPKFLAAANQQPSKIQLANQIVWPVEIGETEMVHVFKVENANAHMAISMSRALILPDHYTSMSTETGSQNAVINAGSILEEIHAPSVGNLWYWGLEQCGNLKEIDCPNVTGWTFDILTSNRVSSVMKFNLPKNLAMPGVYGNDGAQIDVTGSDLSACTEWGGNFTGQTGFGRLVGLLILPALTTVHNSRRVNGNLTLRTPALESMDKYFAFADADSGANGVLKWYIGPNLSSVTCASNITGNAAKFEFHIPAGSSTTKTTLDGLGISYTQDYEFTHDLT